MADYTDNGLMQPGQERYVIQAFRGIDDHERIADGSWQEMINLTAEEYPAAKTRRARKVAGYRHPHWKLETIAIRISSESGTEMVFGLTPGETPQEAPYDAEVMGNTYRIKAVEDTTIGGLPSHNLITSDLINYDAIWTALHNGEDVYMQDLKPDAVPMLIGKPVDAATVDGVMVTACEGGIITYGDRIMPTGAGIRHIAQMGRMIYCDNGILIDPVTDDVKRTWQRVSVDGPNYTVQNCDAGGALITINQTEPATPQDGDYWYDSVRDGLYQWSDGQQEWIAIATMYLKITMTSATDLANFAAGDVVEATMERAKSTYIVHSVDNNNHVIVLRGMLYPTPTPTVGIIIERKMPVLDYICEHDNRIWGCRYGMNGEGEDAQFVNEIYCCALGDPMNWYLYEGTAADSWTASVGAPGQWTGIRECGEYLIFFKEDCFFVLSGSAPANYRLTKFEADGVQDGCDRSIQNIGGSLYYKSVHGIRKLTPYGYPQDVSEALGNDRWTAAKAGTDGRRYYVLMKNNNTDEFYVLDTETGIWTREDAPQNVMLMMRSRNEVLAICAAEGDQFAYVTYDREGATAAMPKRQDYDNPAAWYAAYMFWMMRTVVSRSWAGLSVLELMTTWSATSFDDLEDKADEKIEDGYYLQKNNFWSVRYVLLRDAGRNMPTPPGYTVYSGDDALTELDGVWEDEPDAQWYGVTGLMGLNLPDEKRVRVIQLRLKTDARTRMSVKIQTDESGRWTEIWNVNRGRTGTYRIAYTPAGRNDTFRFRLEGTGPMVLYSITYQLEQGGDLNVPEHTKT